MMPVSPLVCTDNLKTAAIRDPLAAAGYVREDELRRILTLRPTWLVMGKSVPWSFDGGDADRITRHDRLFYEDTNLRKTFGLSVCISACHAKQENT